jgi:3-hydroxyacyl-CoA dehydrogenase
MPSVAIIGAGLIGRAWAMVFARSGWDVRLTDPDAGGLDRAPRLVREGLEELATTRPRQQSSKCGRARHPLSRTLAEPWTGVESRSENGPEITEVKRAIFAELDRLTPKTAILASSTSAIHRPLALRKISPGRSRCLVAHTRQSTTIWCRCRTLRSSP